MNKLLKVLVLAYQGNVYTREVYENDNTVYMDSEIASFNTMEEANHYIDQNYGPHAYDVTVQINL